MALPNTNISTSLVGQTLGSSSRDVGTLCTHPNINKWSKWKPVRRNTVSGIDISDLQAVNYGLALPFILPNTPERLRDMYINGTANWSYRKPRGGQIDEPFRLGDFRNYNHYALNPMGGYYITSKVQNFGANTNIMGSVLISHESGDYNIGFDEMAQEYKYLGMAVFNDQNFMTANTVNLTPNASTVEVNMSGKLAGNYKAMMYLQDSIFLPDNPQITSLDNFPSALFPVEVTSAPIAGEVTTSLQAQWLPSNNYLSKATATISIENTTANNTITFNNVTAKLRRSGKTFDEPMTAGEQTLTLGNVTKNTSVSGGKTILLNFLEEVDMRDGWTVWWRCTGTFARTQLVDLFAPQ